MFYEVSMSFFLIGFHTCVRVLNSITMSPLYYVCLHEERVIFLYYEFHYSLPTHLVKERNYQILRINYTNKLYINYVTQVLYLYKDVRSQL